MKPKFGWRVIPKGALAKQEIGNSTHTQQWRLRTFIQHRPLQFKVLTVNFLEFFVSKLNQVQTKILFHATTLPGMHCHSLLQRPCPSPSLLDLYSSMSLFVIKVIIVLIIQLTVIQLIVCSKQQSNQ